VIGLLAFSAILVRSAAAAPPTTTFYLDDPGPTGANLAGVYTSPYLGQTSYPTSAIVPVICDDFADESYVPEEWTAYVTTLPQVLNSTYGTTDNYLKFGTSLASNPTPGEVTGSDAVTPSWILTQAQAYEAAALLAVDILNTSGTVQQDYSFAMWGLFESSQAFGQLAAYSDTTDEANAENYLNAAITDVLTNNVNGQSLGSYLSGYNVTIYSYDTGASCPGVLNNVCASTPPQEFINVTTPEASTPVLFAVDILGFVALLAFLRKRIVARSI
jgi:hypothetical protein